MPKLLPILAVGAAAFLLIRRDRTEGLWGEGLKPGIHDVKVGETIKLKPSQNSRKAEDVEVTKGGITAAPEADYMDVTKGRVHPEITFKKAGTYKVIVIYDDDKDPTTIEYGFNVS